MSTQAPYPTVSNTSQLDEMLASIEELPSVPETLIQILRVLDDPDSGPSDLAEVVRLDAPLMAKILRLANSPYYTKGSELADINRCVSVLGYRTVRQVAICVSVATSVVSAVARAKGRLDYRELWRHSVVTAAVAKHLATFAGYPDPEEVFTAGLLHDMGKFVLEIHAPETYDHVIARRAQEKRPLVELETEAFGFDHAAIGAAFGKAWRFPRTLVACFGEHHTVRVGDPAQQPEDRAVALVALADYLANTIEPSRSDLGFDPRLVDAVNLHAAAGIQIKDVEDRIAELREAIALASAYLDLASS